MLKYVLVFLCLLAGCSSPARSVRPGGPPDDLGYFVNPTRPHADGGGR